MSNVLPMRSPALDAQHGLATSYAAMRVAIAEAETVAQAYALWRHLRGIEQQVMALTQEAAVRMEELETSEMQKGVGL